MATLSSIRSMTIDFEAAQKPTVSVSFKIGDRMAEATIPFLEDYDPWISDIKENLRGRLRNYLRDEFARI